MVLRNALQGPIKGDVHNAKRSHSSASQGSMSTVLSRGKREENYRTRISTNSIMILQHIRPGSSSAQVSSAVLTAAISVRPSTVSLTLAERSTGRRSELCVCNSDRCRYSQWEGGFSEFYSCVSLISFRSFIATRTQFIFFENRPSPLDCILFKNVVIQQYLVCSVGKSAVWFFLTSINWFKNYSIIL